MRWARLGRAQASMSASCHSFGRSISRLPASFSETVMTAGARLRLHTGGHSTSAWAKLRVGTLPPSSASRWSDGPLTPGWSATSTSCARLLCPLNQRARMGVMGLANQVQAGGVGQCIAQALFLLPGQLTDQLIEPALDMQRDGLGLHAVFAHPRKRTVQAQGQ